MCEDCLVGSGWLQVVKWEWCGGGRWWVVGGGVIPYGAPSPFPRPGVSGSFGCSTLAPARAIFSRRLSIYQTYDLKNKFFIICFFIETQRRGKPNTLTRSNVRKGSADISYGYMYIHICFILLVRYEIIHTCICVSVYLYVCYTCIFFYIILYDYALIIKFSTQCLAPSPSSNQLTG